MAWQYSWQYGGPMTDKRKRRDPHDGAVYRYRNGWAGQLDLGIGREGQRRRKTVYGPSKIAVLRKLDEAKAELRARGDLATSDTQLGKWLDYWLENIAAQRLKPKTLATYRVAVKSHIKPSIGNIRLGRLSPQHLRKMHLDTMSGGKKGRSPTTAHHAHRVLSAALKDAVLEGRVYRNIAAEMPAPAKAESERTGLSAAVAKSLLATAEGELKGRWLLALLYGMRQGERLGLRWSHIDFDDNLIDLSWSLSRVTYAHGCVPAGDPTCGKKQGRSCPQRQLPIPAGMRRVVLHSNLVLLTPKTKGSVRVVPMLPPVRLMLAQRLEAVEAERPNYDKNLDLVWCTPKGLPLDPRRDWAEWTALLKSAGVDHVTLHEARNTAATLLLEAGVDAKVIGAILGHSQVVTTRGYQRVSVELARQALEGVAQRLELGG